MQFGFVCRSLEIPDNNYAALRGFRDDELSEYFSSLSRRQIMPEVSVVELVILAVFVLGFLFLVRLMRLWSFAWDGSWISSGFGRCIG